MSPWVGVLGMLQAQEDISPLGTMGEDSPLIQEDIQKLKCGTEQLETLGHTWHISTMLG